MDQLKIKERVEALLEEYENIVSTGTFCYDKRFTLITETILALQNECAHKFVDGECEYCHRLEGEQ